MHVDVEFEGRLLQKVVKILQANEKVLRIWVYPEVVAEASLARGPVLVEVGGTGSPKRVGDASPLKVTADLKWTRLFTTPEEVNCADTMRSFRGELVGCCFKPSQPQRITPRLRIEPIM